MQIVTHSQGRRARKINALSFVPVEPGAGYESLCQLAKNAKSLRAFSIFSMPTITKNKTLKHAFSQTQIR